ncbi:sigma-70 family RNA polymerase sigma factor [Alloalcanivorax xenomutans]|uniref:sigma-70 family RNA polymerase sigma factor n=1 Tax=Alloalcanivorax xenomutans TaxID=1094342 RepID=UPI003BAADC45
MTGTATNPQPLPPRSQGEIGALYEAHHGWLTHWLHHRLRCPQDAADLSHDTFLRLILGDQPLEALREPRAYLLVIASRLLINRHHRKQVEEEALRQVATLLETQDNRGPAEIAAARDLLVSVIKLLVDELPEKPRRAFLMARLEGLSYRQIGRRLSVSESSVKQYLARALAHCHARLYDSLDPPCRT